MAFENNLFRERRAPVGMCSQQATVERFKNRSFGVFPFCSERRVVPNDIHRNNRITRARNGSHSYIDFVLQFDKKILKIRTVYG